MRQVSPPMIHYHPCRNVGGRPLGTGRTGEVSVPGLEPLATRSLMAVLLIPQAPGAAKLTEFTEITSLRAAILMMEAGTPTTEAA